MHSDTLQTESQRIMLDVCEAFIEKVLSEVRSGKASRANALLAKKYLIQKTKDYSLCGSMAGIIKCKGQIQMIEKYLKEKSLN